MNLIRVFFITAFCLFISSCSFFNPQKNVDKSLKLGIEYGNFDPDFNPLVEVSTAEGTVQHLIYSSLFQEINENELTPLLVKSWTTNKNKTIWDISLKENIKFHDGTSMDAEDVIYTFNQLINKIKNGFYYSLTPSVKSFKIINKKSFQMELIKYDDFFRFLLQNLPILKKDSLNPDKDFKHVGTGPFIFESYDINNKRILLTKNQNYFEEGPFLDKVILQLAENQLETISLILTDKVDAIFLTDSSYIKQFINKEKFVTLPQYAALYFFLEFNFLKNDKLNKNMRLALNYAIPKDEILNKIDPTSVNTGIIHSLNIDNPDKPFLFDYDFNKAKSLIEESGYTLVNNHFVDKNGNALTLTLSANELNEFSSDILQYVARYLNQVGIKTKVTLSSTKEIIENRFNNLGEENYDLLFWMMNMRIKNIIIYNYWHSKNQNSPDHAPSYSNITIDQLLEKIRFSASLEERNKAYSELETAIAQDPPLIFLYWRLPTLIINSRFKGTSKKIWDFTLEIPHLWIE